MTLNQIVDDIILTCTFVDEDFRTKVHRRQVESWVHAYRLLLLKQEVSRNSVVDPTYVSHMRFSFKDELAYTVDDMFPDLQTGNIEKLQYLGKYTGATPYKSNEKLPQLAPLPGRVGIITAVVYNRVQNDVNSPENIAAEPIPIEDISRSYYGAYSKWGGERMSLSVYDGYLLLFKYGSPLEPALVDGIYDKNLAYVMCGVILANPEDYPDISTVKAGELQIPWRDKAYPMPDDRVPRLKQMIFANELSWVFPQQLQQAQVAKQEEQEIQTNPQATLQTGADLYNEVKL